ncbi:LysM peptidoglycan-binding domain-containing protein [Sporolactobacillus sp. THM7-4]|nr:LysM peptidoglycan-binding domain-containing protein [Sporolactobacillus sp. THM7-4]
MKKVWIPAAIVGGLIFSAGGQEVFAASGQAVVNKALEFQGKPYVYGAPSFSTSVFDCSSFTQLIFKLTTGITLPRTSAAQAGVGSYVDRHSVQPGDLLFFDTSGDGGIHHVGIYIGNGKMISSETTVGVHITNVFKGGGSENYWSPKFKIARRVSGSIRQEKAPAKANPGTANTQVSKPQSSLHPAGSVSYYTVKSGDSLWRIAHAHKLSLARLKSINHLKSDLIFPGQKLKLTGPASASSSKPAVQKLTKWAGANARTGGIYKVVKGDSLWEIATMNGITVNKLMRANHLFSTIIYPGQHLTIPKS